MLSIGESLRPLLPVVILFPLIYLWAALSQTDIIDNHPRCYYMLSGTVFANITVGGLQQPIEIPAATVHRDSSCNSP